MRRARGDRLAPLHGNALRTDCRFRKALVDMRFFFTYYVLKVPNRIERALSPILLRPRIVDLNLLCRDEV